VKYALLVYDVGSEWEGVTPEQYAGLVEEYNAISALPQTEGGRQLQGIETARSVRVRDGKPIVTDGPFAETKEVLGGFYLVDAASRDEAEAIAATIPSARMGGVIEVRPIVEYPES
jgi:hypothetical protein